MIFSKEKWDVNGELRQVIKVSKALSFDKMESSLCAAWNQFIVPVLGEAMTAKLIEIYESKEPTNQVKLDLELLQLCQRANGNLALWYNYDELSLSITDAGFQRQESESMKSLYKYQETSLRNGFKNKGFNALDEVLLFLERNIEFYPEYKSSYTLYRNNIVRSTEEVNQTYFINNSRLIFLRLQTHLQLTEQTNLLPALGVNLYDYLVKSIPDTNLSDDEKVRVEALRIKAGKVIIMYSVQRLLQETGSVTDRGLYFTSISGGGGDETVQPVELERINIQVRQANADAQSYLTSLMRYVKTTFPDLYVGDIHKVYDRDNDNKKTFWA